MSLVAALGIAVVVVFHIAVSTIGIRFFRIRMDTQWGAALYAATALPFVLLVSMLVLTGPLGLGGQLGGTDVVVLLLIVFPVVLGVTIDVFWMPAPEEIDLPDTD